MSAVVLDSEALLRLVAGGRGEKTIRATLQAAHNTGAAVAIPAAVLADLYRGGTRDEAIDAFLTREAGLEIVPTDRGVARTVGNVLAAAKRTTRDHVDATVVATAIKYGGGIVVTRDKKTLEALRAGLTQITVVPI
jgi:predicted nucleic acid-binding protein